MNELLKLVSEANGFLWGTNFLIPLLCGTGLFFTLRLGFVQISKFGTACKKLFGFLNSLACKRGVYRQKI